MFLNQKKAVTPEIIAGWKRKHGEVFEITAGEHIAYFRNLQKQDYHNGSLRKVLSSEPEQTVINTLNITWLGGDKAFLTDDMFALLAFHQLRAIYEKRLKVICPFPNNKF